MDDWRKQMFDELDFRAEKKKTLEKKEMRRTIINLMPEQQKPLWKIIEESVPIPNKSAELLAEIVVNVVRD